MAAYSWFGVAFQRAVSRGSFRQARSNQENQASRLRPEKRMKRPA